MPCNVKFFRPKLLLLWLPLICLSAFFLTCTKVWWLNVFPGVCNTIIQPWNKYSQEYSDELIVVVVVAAAAAAEVVLTVVVN